MQNPELYAEYIRKNKQKYQRRKQEGKVANIHNLPPTAQKSLRKKWKDESKRAYQRIKRRKRNIDGNSSPGSDLNDVAQPNISNLNEEEPKKSPTCSKSTSETPLARSRRSLPGSARESNTLQKHAVSSPKSLRVLCERAVKKYRLLPEPKKFTPPETFSVVGGKPLRKRTERVPYVKQKKEKRYDPKSLVWLCQLVVEEYNLLPQTEETLLPSAQTLPYKKNVEKKRGRPRKRSNPEEPYALRCEIKRPRGRPHKNSSEDSFVVKYTYPQQTEVSIKEELDLPPDQDPLQQQDPEEEYTIEIKEEVFEENDAEFPIVPVSEVTPQGIFINPLAAPPANTMTVVLDEYQIFANNIAEQLRTLPPQRALLLQVDIQSMIDNEKQLMSHEN